MPPSNLPKHAQEIYTAAEENARQTTCKGRDDIDECAARIAWAAVKQKYFKGSDGNWHPKADIVEFDLAITKASYDKATGEMRWVATASDTDSDLYGERMSLELFSDFIRRAEMQEKPPEDYCSSAWCGGMPYVSISHYPDLDGFAVPGETRKLYIDGKQLKAQGIFYDTDLGRACFRAVCDSLYNKELSDKPKVRISIGFLDYKHSHDGVIFDRKSLLDKCPMCTKGIGGKQYLSGLLIHLALTRVPVNQRTSIEAEVGKSMTTRKEDAASIIGEELADEIDKKALLVNKSESLVERSDEDDEKLESSESPDVEIVEDAITKKEADGEHPASDYLVVEDEKKPSTWHLRVKNHGKPDHRLMGAAWAALHGGYRGNKYEGPNKAEAITKLKKLYTSENLEVPSEKAMITDSDIEETLPFGGAVSFADAQAYMDSVQEMQGIYNGWYMLNAVISNIFQCEACGDKKKAIKRALDEFKSSLEAKALVALSKLDDDSFTSRSSATRHVLDDAVALLKDEFDKVVKADIPTDEKLRIFQEPFNQFASVLQSEISKAVADPAPDVIQETFSRQDVSNMIQDAVRPLDEKLTLLLTQLSSTASVNAVRSATPVKRNLSLDPQVLQKVTQNENPNSIRAIARRSVGLSN